MFSLENACDIYKPVSVKTMAQKILYSYCQWDESCAINANPMTPQGEIKQTAGGGVQHPAPHLLTFSVKKKKADSYFERDGINLLNGDKIHCNTSNHTGRKQQLKSPDPLSHGDDVHNVRKF